MYSNISYEQVFLNGHGITENESSLAILTYLHRNYVHVMLERAN